MAGTSHSIVTRNGDGGRTRLFSGEDVDKDHPRTCAYGDLDELVSILGLAAAGAETPSVVALLRDVQRHLFVVGTELSTTAAYVSGLRERVGPDHVARIDRWCADLEARIDMPTGFILPGGTVAAAHIDHARAVARRLERSVTGLMREGSVENEFMRVWLNRLSDLLWLLAREEEGPRVLLKDRI